MSTDAELEELAKSAEGEFVRGMRDVLDFRFDLSQDKYWDLVTGQLLGDRAVDAAVGPLQIPNGKPIRASVAIRSRGYTVEGSTWWPGEPRIIEDHYPTSNGLLHLAGAATYNAYRAPEPLGPGSSDAGRWVDHVRYMYGAEAEHFFDFCAHAVQRPGEKVNHGLVLSGGQGIGKDLALRPLLAAVGKDNYQGPPPDAVLSPYNGFAQSTLLVINEVRPFRDSHKATDFYNGLKLLLAAPPDTLAVDRKYANTVYIPNLVHVLFTTNDPLAIYIPDADRRLYVMNSRAAPQAPEYYRELAVWYEAGGDGAVARWLGERDLSQFSPKAPPPMTAAKQAIIDSSAEIRATPLDEVLDDFLEAAGNPDVFFATDVTNYVKANRFDDAEAVLHEITKRKRLVYKAEDRGYTLKRNPDGQRWKRGAFHSRQAYVRGAADPMAAVRAALESRG